MKRVVQIMRYDKASFAEHGFITDRQQTAACCVAELLEEISKCNDNFGMMIYFISEADMLGDRPMTIWSGITIETQRKLFEDYVLNRLKLKEDEEAKGNKMDATE